jgi:hypothetical protein
MTQALYAHMNKKKKNASCKFWGYTYTKKII